jgi:hypothetical protein
MEPVPGGNNQDHDVYDEMGHKMEFKYDPDDQPVDTPRLVSGIRCLECVSKIDVSKGYFSCHQCLIQMCYDCAFEMELRNLNEVSSQEDLKTLSPTLPMLNSMESHNDNTDYWRMSIRGNFNKVEHHETEIDEFAEDNGFSDYQNKLFENYRVGSIGGRLGFKISKVMDGLRISDIPVIHIVGDLYLVGMVRGKIESMGNHLYFKTTSSMQSLSQFIALRQ